MKTPKDESKKTNRRTAIKIIGGGAVTTGITGQSWQKPVVDAVVIPAHANMTAGGGEPGAGTPAPTTAPATTAPPPMDSDLRLKTDITEVGKSHNGHRLYSFRYVNDETQKKYVGVMAQDLLAKHAEAVVTREDGYFQVDYGKLGLQMVSLDKWQEQGESSVLRFH